MKAKRKMTMSKQEFIDSVSNSKVKYMKSVEAYFDALIECDFDKANKMGAELMTVLDPEAEAYIAKNSYDLDSYYDLEKAYRKYQSDTKSFLN